MHTITPWLKGTGTAALFGMALGHWIADLRNERRASEQPDGTRAGNPIANTDGWPDDITHRLRV